MPEVAPADGTDLRSPTGGDTRQVADTTIGEVFSRESKVRSLPKPTTGSSPKSEPVTTDSAVDVRKQGRDTRRGQGEPVATDSEVGTGEQGRGTRRHDHVQREPVATDSETNPPEQSASQSEAPAQDQPPDRSAKTKGDHAVRGEGRRDG